MHIPRRIPGGGVGEIRVSIEEIIVFTADEKNNTMGELVATTVEENQVYNMTILLDGDYLADPNTTYPIRIDPTVSIQDVVVMILFSPYRVLL